MLKPKPRVFFGIKIVTYARKKNKTPELLTRTADSILKQTYPYWKVFLMGDRYEPDSEFQELTKLFPANKILAINNTGPVERDEYTGKQLWMCCGISSINKMMDVMEKEISICTTIDDDDIWHPDHLETLADGYRNFPEAAFIYTKGMHVQMGEIPKSNPPLEYDNKPPMEHDTIHSCTSWKMNLFPLRYHNTVGSVNPMPGDADLWVRMKQYMKYRCLKSLYIPKLTVWHDEHNPSNEGAFLKPHSEFLA